MPNLIAGIHAIVYSREADKVRALFKDILEFPSVDAGGGWLIFALPPAEMGIHPAEGAGHHELYLMCDDVHASVEMLKAKGVEFAGEIIVQGWGLVTRLKLPGGDEIGLYQPRHPTPR